MDEFAREAFDLEYYWGRVEFAPGRGAIHLHILGIAKNKAYLHDFHNAKGENKKIEVLQNYAVDSLGMTADVKVDENHYKFQKDGRNTTTIDMSPLGTRYSTSRNPELNHIHLAQDAMLHACTEYCLGDVDKDAMKLRTCRLGYGTEETSYKGDTPGREHCSEPTIEKKRQRH